MSAELATVAADPSRVGGLKPGEVRGLIAELEGLKVLLWERLYASAIPAAAPALATRPDRLLTVEEAARRPGVSRRWMYRKASTLPFTKRLSQGCLRFSELGLEKWKESRPGPRGP
jgi:predicted DNA-binding transcriptional regulator AlpA